jgi:hypothetical protein
LTDSTYVCTYVNAKPTKGIKVAYINPNLVTSPKGRVANLTVIYDGGEGDYSVATMLWDGKPATGVRWNGGDGAMFQGLGNPQSRGIPTWFILPDPIAELISKNPAALRSNI